MNVHNFSAIKFNIADIDTAALVMLLFFHQ